MSVPVSFGGKAKSVLQVRLPSFVTHSLHVNSLVELQHDAINTRLQERPSAPASVHVPSIYPSNDSRFCQVILLRILWDRRRHDVKGRSEFRLEREGVGFLVSEVRQSASFIKEEGHPRYNQRSRTSAILLGRR